MFGTWKLFILQRYESILPSCMLDWIHTTNIYEVNLRQYTEEGTFNAFSKHLDRLKEMGVHTLWFMPLTPIAEENKKGKIAVGQFADLIVVDNDPTTVSPQKISSINIVTTIVGGQIVFQKN